MTVSLFLQNLSNGIALGSLYALIAIGYTMVYGIIRLINFAHGNIFATGAYLAFVFVAMLGIHWAFAYVLAIFLTALVGLSTDRIAYRPLREAPRISALISAIAVSFILENLLVIIFGGRPKSFPRPAIFDKVLELGEVRIPSVNIFIIAITAILLAALIYMLYRTKTGRAMRALSYDFDTARLMGVNVNKTIALTFIIGSALAAVAGIMIAEKFPQINPYMATQPGLKAFIAAVFGGIGSVQGAAIGGLMLGLLEILFVAFFPDLSGYRDAIAFILLIVVLIYKPTGLMGVKGKVKV
jgi:branched-chain amino acid transport system permease protein